jgi:hypothetical protein
MANLPNKLFTFTTLLLLGSAYSCSGGDSSDDSPVESSPISAPISLPESTLPVAPPTEPLANVAPSVTYTDIDAVITLLSSESVNINYAVDDDSDDVTTNLYHSSTSINCSESNISDWSLAATSTELSATLSWSHTESSIYKLCLVADDGEERHYSVINSNFIVLPTGMELWLKSDTGISESSGSIARWDDQSGKERNFVAESEVNKPLLKNSSLKGKDTVYFDGINDFLTNSDDFNVTTSIVVFKTDSASQASNQLAELWGDYVGKVHVSIDPRSPGSFSFDGKSPSSTTAKYYLEGSSFSTHIANGKRQDSWNYDETHFLVSDFN